jgi:DMSO/TMAO reductase YedYZ molybdopterin-dependent catalytic subunit
LNTLGRRNFLMGSAGAIGLASVGGMTAGVARAAEEELPDYAAWKKKDALILHTKNTMETRREAIGAKLITPSDELFVRNNLPTPDPQVLEDADAWMLDIAGVAKPGSMSLGELKALGVESVACVLQCSGNGRVFFKHESSGTQWSVGAAGNVLWTGVPVRDVVAAMGGLVEGAAWMTGTGGEDIPEGVPPETIQVQRSVPIAALDNAILAWDMNGEPLSLAHGGPLRLVIPGYYGVNNVKYIKTLAFGAEESKAKIQTSSYRIRDVGAKSDPSQPSMFEMNVKSWISSPLETADAGMAQIQGVAFGGISALTNVEVSIDGGKSWEEARFLGPDMGPFSWRPFAFSAELPAGAHVLASRASAANGSVQPEEFAQNERGYGHNGWRDHAVEVTVS